MFPANKFKIIAGPYKGRTVFLKRIDNMNKMRFVLDVSNHEMLLVYLSELSDHPVKNTVKRYKLKIKR